MFRYLCLLVALCCVQALAQTCSDPSEILFYIPQRCYPLGIGAKAEYISLDNATAFSLLIYNDNNCAGSFQVDESYEYNKCYTQSEEDIVLTFNYTLQPSTQLPLKNAYQTLFYPGGCSNQTEAFASITVNPDACFPTDTESYKYSCNQTHGLMQLFSTSNCLGLSQIIPFPLATCLDSQVHSCYNPSNADESYPTEHLKASQYLRGDVKYSAVSKSSFHARQFQELRKLAH